MKRRTDRWPCILAIAVCGGAGTAGAADLTFTRHIIATDNTALRTISAGDVDGDGDVDVFTAVSLEDEVRWYVNDGAPTPSFTNVVLTDRAVMSDFVFTADVNGDGNLDVVFNSSVDDTIGWFENDGGSPPTLIERVVDEDPNGLCCSFLPDGFANTVRQTAAADFDGDNDLDMCTASVDDNRVALFWNNETSWDPVALTDSLEGARCIHAADLDGDNDPDIVAGPWYGGEILWWENGGGPTPAFTEHVLIAYPPEEDDPVWGHAQAWRIVTADLDGDLDLDVVIARRHMGVDWYENDGGTPPAFTRHTIANHPDDVFIMKSVHVGDMDSDGDVDILAASRGDDKISWFENLGGRPSAFLQHVVTEDPDGPNPCCPLEGVAAGARSIWAADVDGDTDLDILWAAMDTNTIAWEENHLIDPPPPPPVCPLDLSGDGQVGIDELLALLAAWGPCPGCDEDTNDDDVVDIDDLLDVLGGWGPCPPA